MAAGTSVVDIDPAPTGALGGPRAVLCFTAPPRRNWSILSINASLFIDRSPPAVPARPYGEIDRAADRSHQRVAVTDVVISISRPWGGRVGGGR